MSRRGKTHPIERALGIATIWYLLYLCARFVARGVNKLLFRWRRFLLPWWTGLACFLVAIILRAVAPSWWPIPLLLPIVGITAALYGPRLHKWGHAILVRLVPTTLDEGKRGILDRFSERVYLATFLSYVGGWMTLRAATGGTTLTAWLWWVGLLAFGGVWWFHRRVRIVGRADRYLRKWRKLADPERTIFRGLAGSKAVAAWSEGYVAYLRVKLIGGYTADEVDSNADKIASFYHLRPGAVRVIPDKRSAQHIIVSFLPRDPWKGVLKHPLPEPGSVSLAEHDALLNLGVLATGQLDFWRVQHALLVGQNKSGKSTLLENMLIWLSACSDCRLLGSDTSEATLGMWEPVLSMPLATSHEGTVHLLERTLRLIETRTRMISQWKQERDDAPDFIEPSDDVPWFVFALEEYPAFVNWANSLAKKERDYVLGLTGRIGKEGRKAGVWLIPACQNASKVDTGSKELQAQLLSTFGLHLDRHANNVLWGGRGEWDCVDLQKGQYLLRDSDHERPLVSKGYYATMEERHAHIRAAAVLPRDCEPAGWVALTGLSATQTDGDAGAGAALALPASDRRSAVLAALPATAGAVATSTDIPRSTVHRYLATLRSDGAVVQDGGVWKRVDKDAA